MGSDEERARGIAASGVASAMDGWRGRVREREREGPRLRGVGKIGEGGGGVRNKTGGNVKDGGKEGKVLGSSMLRRRGRAGTEKPSEGRVGQ